MRTSVSPEVTDDIALKNKKWNFYVVRALLNLSAQVAKSSNYYYCEYNSRYELRAVVCRVVSLHSERVQVVDIEESIWSPKYGCKGRNVMPLNSTSKCFSYQVQKLCFAHKS